MVRSSSQVEFDPVYSVPGVGNQESVCAEFAEQAKLEKCGKQGQNFLALMQGIVEHHDVVSDEKHRPLSYSSISAKH